MKLVYAVWGLALAVAACGGGERTATAETGTAEATVTTEASRDEVPDIQLQQQAQQAATAASEPVDGSGPSSRRRPSRSSV